MQTQVMKQGHARFYFPDYPQHPFNGATAHWASPVERRITTFKATAHNLNSPSAYWQDEFEVKPEHFPGNPQIVRVKLWYNPNFYVDMDHQYFEIGCQA